MRFFWFFSGFSEHLGIWEGRGGVGGGGEESEGVSWDFI